MEVGITCQQLMLATGASSPSDLAPSVVRSVVCAVPLRASKCDDEPKERETDGVAEVSHSESGDAVDLQQ